LSRPRKVLLVEYVRRRFSPALALLAGWGRFFFGYFGFVAAADRVLAGVGPAGRIGCICCVLMMFVQRVSDDIRDFDDDVAQGTGGDAMARRHPAAAGEVSVADLRRFRRGAAVLVMLAHVPALVAGHVALFAAVALVLLFLTTDWSRARACPPSVSAWVLFGYSAAAAMADGAAAGGWALFAGGAAARSLLVAAALWLPALTWQYSRKAQRWPAGTFQTTARVWRVAALALLGAVAACLVTRWWDGGWYVVAATATTSMAVVTVCFIALRMGTIPARALRAVTSLHIVMLLGLPPLSAFLHTA